MICNERNTIFTTSATMVIQSINSQSVHQFYNKFENVQFQLRTFFPRIQQNARISIIEHILKHCICQLLKASICIWYIVFTRHPFTINGTALLICFSISNKSETRFCGNDWNMIEFVFLLFIFFFQVIFVNNIKNQI